MGKRFLVVALLAWGLVSTGALAATPNEKFTPAGDVQVVAPVEQTVAPGGSATYGITVTNFTGGSVTFDLAATSSHGWTTQIRNGLGQAITSVLVGADNTANVTVVVAVPAGAAPGTADLLTLRATNHDNTAIGASDITTTQVAAAATSSTSFDFSRDAVGAGCGTIFRVGGGGGPGPTGGAAAAAFYLALILLPPAASRRLRRTGRPTSRAAAIALAAASFLLAATLAEAGGLVPKAQRFRPTQDGFGTVTVDSDETLPAGKTNEGVFLNLVKRPFNQGEPRDLNVTGEIVHDLATLDIFGSYGVGYNAEIGVDVPVNFLLNGRTPPGGGESSNLSFGDIRVGGKWRFLSGKTYGLAVVPYYNFATGDRDRFLSEGKNALGGKLAGHLDLTDRLSLVGNVGAEKPGSLTASKGSPDRYSTWFQYGGGAVCRLDPASAVTAEINGETPWKDAFKDQRVSPVEFLAAYRKIVAPNVTFHVGGGGGLNKGMGAPQWRGFLGLSYLR